MHALKPLFALVLAAIISLPLTSVAQLQPNEEIGEGFDKQSPAEIEKARVEIESLFGSAVQPKSLNSITKSQVLQKYQHLDPKGEVPTDLLADAVLFFDQNISKFPNQAYITVIDFKPRSDVRRFFLINMTTGGVEKFYTTHGVGSDKNKNGIAEVFGENSKDRFASMDCQPPIQKFANARLSCMAGTTHMKNL